MCFPCHGGIKGVAIMGVDDEAKVWHLSDSSNGCTAQPSSASRAQTLGMYFLFSLILLKRPWQDLFNGVYVRDMMLGLLYMFSLLDWSLLLLQALLWLTFFFAPTDYHMNGALCIFATSSFMLPAACAQFNLLARVNVRWSNKSLLADSRSKRLLKRLRRWT